MIAKALPSKVDDPVVHERVSVRINTHATIFGDGSRVLPECLGQRIHSVWIASWTRSTDQPAAGMMFTLKERNLWHGQGPLDDELLVNSRNEVCTPDPSADDCQVIVSRISSVACCYDPWLLPR